ncbi:MAG: DUF427 domain-containing protein [Bacteroidota bacterium]
MIKKIKPKKGQESVWDYPRPPRLEPCSKELIVECDGIQLLATNAAFRVLETSHPPVYYIPQSDIKMEFLRERTAQGSFCEFKGVATYWDIVTPKQERLKAAWSYASPTASFSSIKDHLAFYASKVDACYVDGEQVQAQEGDFYGGWITLDIVGPFKGGVGTWGW